MGNVGISPGQRLGVAYQDMTAGLLVIAVSDGSPVHKWNQDHPDKQISRGDVIVTANGHAVAPEKKPADYAVDGRLTLRVSRGMFQVLRASELNEQDREQFGLSNHLLAEGTTLQSG